MDFFWILKNVRFRILGVLNFKCFCLNLVFVWGHWLLFSLALGVKSLIWFWRNPFSHIQYLLAKVLLFFLWSLWGDCETCSLEEGIFSRQLIAHHDTVALQWLGYFGFFFFCRTWGQEERHVRENGIKSRRETVSHRFCTFLGIQIQCHSKWDLQEEKACHIFLYLEQK